MVTMHLSRINTRQLLGRRGLNVTDKHILYLPHDGAFLYHS